MQNLSGTVLGNEEILGQFSCFRKKAESEYWPVFILQSTILQAAPQQREGPASPPRPPPALQCLNVSVVSVDQLADVS